MACYLGIDLGTTGVKAVLTDRNGALVGTGYRQYPLDVPQTGYAQQQPEKWWRAMCVAVRDALKKTSTPPQEVRGIGFSGQMHGLVMLDAEKKLLFPAIIHCDARAADQKQQVLSNVTLEQLGQWVQNPLHSGFQALSLLWVRQNHPEIYAKVRHALLPKDYLRFLLTGEMGTEPTDACGTLLFDCKNVCWSAEMLDALQIDRSILPDARHLSYEIAGCVTKRAAKETGLSEGTPVVFGGGDQAMQALGNGLLKPGSSSVNLGTSGQVLASTAKPVYDPLLRTHTFCHAQKETWYVMGAVLNACLAFNWFVNNILHSKNFARMDLYAGDVRPGCGGLVFLPYLAGERTPHMSERARGAFIGMTLGHGRGDLVRAVLEGVAYSLRDSLEIVRSLRLPIDRMTISGGGARSVVWQQIIADVLQTPLWISSMKEQASLGAVICAQVACGEYDSLQQACDAIVRYEPEPITPNESTGEIYAKGFEVYRSAYIQNAPLFDKMHGE